MSTPQPICPWVAAARHERVAALLAEVPDPFVIADLASPEEYRDLDPDAGDAAEPWCALGDLRGDIYVGFASTDPDASLPDSM